MSHKRSLRLLFCGSFIATLLSGCSAGFIFRSAYEQSKILLKRESIEKVIASPETDLETRRKLELVREARNFAEQMGLNPGGSFKTYSETNRESLVWVVAGAKKTAFELYTWWFPIVGRVPYKGFFDKASADAEAKYLESLGYETFVRGADAISTLGWFDDPVLTTMLKNDDHEIVNTVIHESVHSTVWIPNHVPFNETLANFVGVQGHIEFYSAKKNQSDIATALLRLKMEHELSTLLTDLYDKLDVLYSSNLSDSEKIKKRSEIFDATLLDFRSRYPRFKALKKINNAEIMQFKFYLTNFKLFEDTYRSANNWGAFIEIMRSISTQLNRNSDLDPFDLLESKLIKD